MKFLNSKEEVLDIELTQYGKYLLSKGKFNPEYYAFFDTDVLYDGTYAGLNEAQNNVHDRVKETPQLESQYLFHGVETEVSKINQFIRMGGVDAEGRFKELNSKKIQQTPERHYSLTAPLGTISLDSVSAPAWFLDVRDGEISGTTYFKSGDHPTLKIPQIDMTDLEYQTMIKKQAIESDSEVRTDLGLLTNSFPDGSFIDVVEDEITIDVLEFNSINGSENFEIEVFAIEDENVATNEKENLIPLFFASKKLQLVKDGILLEENQINTETATLDTSSVEYFFEILTDEEVEDDILDPAIKRNLYTSTVREEDLKDC